MSETLKHGAAPLIAAVRKLVKAKGRFHTEQNYMALVAALDQYDIDSAANGNAADRAQLAQQGQGWAVEVKPGEICPCGQTREWCIANECQDAAPASAQPALTNDERAIVTEAIRSLETAFKPNAAAILRRVVFGAQPAQQPRSVHDSECKQGRCARPTVGCWVKCGLDEIVGPQGNSITIHICAASPATVTAPAQKDMPESMAASNARFAIDGAIQYGRENRNQPPSADHWLYEYWNIGQQLRELGKTGWDNVTPLATKRCPHCDDTGDVHSPTGEWRGTCTCPAGATVTEPAAPTDDEWDRNAERLTREMGIGGGKINPNATSIDDLFIDDDDAAPAPQQAAPNDWRKCMRDLIRVLRGVENGSDEEWKFIANVCDNAEECLAAPATAGMVGQDARDATQSREWHPVTGPGQVRKGDKLRFKIGDKAYNERAKLILHPGTDKEEVIYDKGRNFYFITSMVMKNTSNHKYVEVLAAQQAQASAKGE